MTPGEKTNYHWIVGKQDDLYWIIGSSGVSLFLLGIYFFLTQTLPAISGIEVSSALVVGVIFLIWTFFFDSTHFFATYSRTFLDRKYLRENEVLLYSSLLILFMGPVFLATTFFLSEPQYQKLYTRAIFALIILGSLLWGYFHLVRQHWGFIALYQKKNKEQGFAQYSLDAFLLSIGCIWPFTYFLNKDLLSEPILIDLLKALQDINLSYYLFYLSLATLLIATFFTRFNPTKALGKLFFVIGAIVLGLTFWNFMGINISLENSLANLELVFRYLFISILLVYAGYYLFFNQDWNIPKFLLLVSVLIAHNLILLSVTDFLLISACLTIFHNIQYHRIVRYFNVNHYQSPDYGISVLLTKKLAYFIVLSLCFSFVVLALRGSVILTDNQLIKMMLITSVINGISLHHYFLDGIIWRTSKDKQLSSSLKLG